MGPALRAAADSQSPPPRSHSAISPKVKVSPASVCSSILTAKISGVGGPVRSSLGMNSLMAMVPPGASAREGLAQEFTAPIRALTVQNMADRRHLMAVAKIRLQKIACHRLHPLAHTVPPGQLPGHLQHRRPVHRVHGHVRRLVRQRDSPYSRAGADIEHTRRRLGPRYAQMLTQNLRRLVTQWENALDKLGKELLPLPCWLAATAGRPVPTTSVSCNQFGRICRITCRKNPPW